METSVSALDSRPVPSAEGTHWEAEIGTTRVVFGPGRLAELGERVAQLGRRALVLTDPGLEAVGHVERAVAALADQGVEHLVLDGVVVNPDSDSVNRLLAPARAFGPAALVALGGGSVLDSAKALNFLLTNGGEIEDYWGFGKAQKPLLPAVAVPTTAGTGSDAQSFAVIAQSGSGRKMACGDLSARFRTVLLDPEVAVTAPATTIATAGLDALSHAVESHVSTRANPVSRLYSRHAWTLLDRRFAEFLAHPTRLEAAGEMLLAAHLAGAAIESSMLGAAHAAANPLTARFGIVHGTAVALMLPQVVLFNRDSADRAYSELIAGGGRELARRLVDLSRLAQLPDSLRSLGVPREMLPELATLAAREWTGAFNPRPVAQGDFLALYEQAF